MATPQQPYPGGHEIYNFRRPFLAHHYYLLSLCEPCPEVKRLFFKEIHQFYTLYPKITSPYSGGGGGGGH